MVAIKSRPKLAIVTGASSGIGRSTAEWFRNAGWNLVLGARRVPLIEEICDSLSKSVGGGSILGLELDVCSKTSIQKFRDRVLKEFPSGPDVLVNNAGLALGRDFVVSGLDSDWETMFETNVLGALRMTKALLPEMIKKSSGHIVMVGSIAAHQVYEGGAAYSGSKHALRAISETLKLELNGTGVRISSIDPGMVETEFSLVRFQQDHEKAKNVYKGMTPLSAADIAEAIGFMVSRPPHVNIDQMIITPTDQASVTKVFRRQ